MARNPHTPHPVLHQRSLQILDGHVAQIIARACAVLWLLLCGDAHRMPRLVCVHLHVLLLLLLSGEWHEREAQLHRLLLLCLACHLSGCLRDAHHRVLTHQQRRQVLRLGCCDTVSAVWGAAAAAGLRRVQPI